LKSIIIDAVKICNIVFKKHAVVRMLERDIESEDVIKSFSDCTVIEEYYDDKPFQSCLVLGFSGM